MKLVLTWLRTNWLIPVIAVALAGGWFAIRRYGDQRAELALWRQRYAALEQVKRGRDTLYRTDTLRLTVTRRHTDSILTREYDTLPVPVPVVREIVRVERAACDSVIRSCEARVAIRDSQIVALQHKPGAPRFPSVTVGPFAGVGTDGTVRVGLGVVVGLRIR